MDIRDYADAILRRLGLILVFTLLAVFVAAIINLFLPPTYEATAIVSVPQLDPSIPLASLIKSPEVEAQVIAALSGTNPLFVRGKGPENLIHAIEVVEGPNMVRITARSDSPRKGALIANTWAEFAVKRIAEAQFKAEEQLKTAEQNLEAANEALRAFENEYGFGIFGFGTAEEDLAADKEQLSLYQSRHARLKQSIEEANTFRKAIRGEDASPSAKAVSSFVINLLQQISQESEERMFQVEVLLMEQQVDQEAIEQYETVMKDIETSLQEAKKLRDAVEQGGSIASPELMSSLIVEFLQSGSTESAMGIDVQGLSLPTEDMSPNQQIAILDTVIAILEGREALIKTSIEQLSAKAVRTLDAAIAALDTEAQELEGRIEELSARIAEREKILTEKRPELERLIVARIEAEEAYMSLADKLQRAEFSAEPRVIASAMESQKPVQPYKVRNMAIAGALGLVLGIFWVFKEERVEGELVWW